MAARRSVWVVIGRPIGVLEKRKIGARPSMVSVQEMIACRDVMRSAPKPKTTAGLRWSPWIGFGSAGLKGTF